MHTPSSADGQVVVGYDGSAASQRALVWAAAVSHALGDGLKIVHAVDLDVVPRRRGSALRPLSPSLEMVAETMVGGPSTWPGRPLARSRVRAVHAFGGPVGELVDASMTADLVILGTRGRGRTRSALIGSVSSAVAARAYSPVVVLHDLGHSAPGARRDVPVPGPEREVVCALTPGTGDAHANRMERIVSAAARIAAGLLRAATPRHRPAADAAGPADRADPQASPYAVATLALAHPDMAVATQTLYGDPVEALAGTSRECGLLVIGAPHRGGVGAVLAGPRRTGSSTTRPARSCSSNDPAPDDHPDDHARSGPGPESVQLAEDSGPGTGPHGIRPRGVERSRQGEGGCWKPGLPGGAGGALDRMTQADWRQRRTRSSRGHPARAARRRRGSARPARAGCRASAPRPRWSGRHR